MLGITAPTLQKSWLRGLSKAKIANGGRQYLTPTWGLITVPMGSQTCLQHPFKQPVSNYFLNILGCSLNVHVTRVSGVAICWFQRKPGDATPARLPACLPAWVLASTFPCPSGPGLNHWLALWLRLLLHSFFWGTVFVSFLVALIKYSDKSLSAHSSRDNPSWWGSCHSHGPGSQLGDGGTHSELLFPSQWTQWR